VKTNFEKAKSETKQKINELQLKERNRFLSFLHEYMTMQMQYYKSSYELFMKLQPQIENLGKEVEKVGTQTINIQMDGVLLKKRKGLGKNWVRYICSIVDGNLVYKPEAPKKKEKEKEESKRLSIVLCSIRKNR